MKHTRLTHTTRLATVRPMTGRGRMGRVLVAAMMAAGVSGCITVKAPDKPIVIELNINIKQEVVYRLAPDAQKTIDTNKGIF